MCYCFENDFEFSASFGHPFGAIYAVFLAQDSSSTEPSTIIISLIGRERRRGEGLKTLGGCPRKSSNRMMRWSPTARSLLVVKQTAAAETTAAGKTATPAVSKGDSKKGGKSAKGGEAQSKKTTQEVKDAPPAARLDIRAGLITKVQRHPDADSLYVEEIDVGEEVPRTVVSGLVKFIPIELMQDRRVCVLSNLKPATMRGIKSLAMVLAASDVDHSEVELGTPPELAKIGERTTFPGFEGEPDEVLNTKKVWETVQPDLATTDELVAVYKDVPFTTSAGVCTVSSILKGSIKSMKRSTRDV